MEPEINQSEPPQEWFNANALKQLGFVHLVKSSINTFNTFNTFVRYEQNIVLTFTDDQMTLTGQEFMELVFEKMFETDEETIKDAPEPSLDNFTYNTNYLVDNDWDLIESNSYCYLYKHVAGKLPHIPILVSVLNRDHDDFLHWLDEMKQFAVHSSALIASSISVLAKGTILKSPKSMTYTYMLGLKKLGFRCIPISEDTVRVTCVSKRFSLDINNTTSFNVPLEDFEQSDSFNEFMLVFLSHYHEAVLREGQELVVQNLGDVLQSGNLLDSSSDNDDLDE